MIKNIALLFLVVSTQAAVQLGVMTDTNGVLTKPLSFFDSNSVPRLGYTNTWTGSNFFSAGAVAS